MSTPGTGDAILAAASAKREAKDTQQHKYMVAVFRHNMGLAISGLFEGDVDDTTRQFQERFQGTFERIAGEVQAGYTKVDYLGDSSSVSWTNFTKLSLGSDENEYAKLDVGVKELLASLVESSDEAVQKKYAQTLLAFAAVHLIHLQKQGLNVDRELRELRSKKAQLSQTSRLSLEDAINFTAKIIMFPVRYKYDRATRTNAAPDPWVKWEDKGGDAYEVTAPEAVEQSEVQGHLRTIKEEPVADAAAAATPGFGSGGAGGGEPTSLAAAVPSPTAAALNAGDAAAAAAAAPGDDYGSSGGGGSGAASGSSSASSRAGDGAALAAASSSASGGGDDGGGGGGGGDSDGLFGGDVAAREPISLSEITRLLNQITSSDVPDEERQQAITRILDARETTEDSGDDVGVPAAAAAAPEFDRNGLRQIQGLVRIFDVCQRPYNLITGDKGEKTFKTLLQAASGLAQQMIAFDELASSLAEENPQLFGLGGDGGEEGALRHQVHVAMRVKLRSMAAEALDRCVALQVQEAERAGVAPSEEYTQAFARLSDVAQAMERGKDTLSEETGLPSKAADFGAIGSGGAGSPRQTAEKVLRECIEQQRALDDAVAEQEEARAAEAAVAAAAAEAGDGGGDDDPAPATVAAEHAAAGAAMGGGAPASGVGGETGLQGIVTASGVASDASATPGAMPDWLGGKKSFISRQIASYNSGKSEAEQLAFRQSGKEFIITRKSGGGRCTLEYVKKDVPEISFEAKDANYAVVAATLAALTFTTYTMSKDTKLSAEQLKKVKAACAAKRIKVRIVSAKIYTDLLTGKVNVDALNAHEYEAIDALIASKNQQEAAKAASRGGPGAGSGDAAAAMARAIQQAQAPGGGAPAGGSTRQP